MERALPPLFFGKGKWRQDKQLEQNEPSIHAQAEQMGADTYAKANHKYNGKIIRSDNKGLLTAF